MLPFWFSFGYNYIICWTNFCACTTSITFFICPKVFILILWLEGSTKQSTNSIHKNITLLFNNFVIFYNINYLIYLFSFIFKKLSLLFFRERWIHNLIATWHINTKTCG